jgi:hypothetical protein
MSTAASSIRNIKSRLPTSNSINNMTNNGNESKSNGIYNNKKPLSATNILQNYSSINGFNNHLKKRSGLSNHFHSNKLIKSASTDGKNNHHHNGHHSNRQSSNNITQSPSSQIIFHVIAPAPLSEELNDSTKQINEKQKVDFFLRTCF